MSTRYIPSKEFIGIRGFIKEGQIVAYSHMLNKIKDELGFDIEKLKTNVKAKIGLYDLNIGKTVYFPIEKVNGQLIKAACSLPLLGRVTKEDGHDYLDGGISDMIPIGEALKDGNEKHLIITTKPLGYRRKPAKKFIVKLMSIVYRKCPNIGRDYEIRHLNYDSQIAAIEALTKKGDAFYRYPTRSSRVTRMGGSTEDLEELFNMGKEDMEASREEIYRLIK